MTPFSLFLSFSFLSNVNDACAFPVSLRLHCAVAADREERERENRVRLAEHLRWHKYTRFTPRLSTFLMCDTRRTHTRTHTYNALLLVNANAHMYDTSTHTREHTDVAFPTHTYTHIVTAHAHTLTHKTHIHIHDAPTAQICSLHCPHRDKRRWSSTEQRRPRATATSATKSSGTPRSPLSPHRPPSAHTQSSRVWYPMWYREVRRGEERDVCLLVK